MFTARFQVVYLVVTIGLFAIVARLSRARARRVAGALAAALVFTALSAPLDDFGIAAGWWSYPTCAGPPHPPIAVYLGQALEFVGSIALGGWRVQRRFGARGVAWLFAIVCAVGPVRDFAAAAALPRLIRFGALPASLFADAAAWAVVVAVALIVSRIVAGRADRDALRPI